MPDDSKLPVPPPGNVEQPLAINGALNPFGVQAINAAAPSATRNNQLRAGVPARHAKSQRIFHTGRP